MFFTKNNAVGAILDYVLFLETGLHPEELVKHKPHNIGSEGETYFGIVRKWHETRFQKWPPSIAEVRLFYMEWGEAIKVLHIGLTDQQAAQLLAWSIHTGVKDDRVMYVIQSALVRSGQGIKPDGILGDQTLKALALTRDDSTFNRSLLDIILGYTIATSNFPKFANGFLARYGVVV